MATRPKDLPEHLLSQGRYTFTTGEAEAILGTERQATLATLTRLRRRGAVFSPAKSLYIVVPPEHRSTGAPPAEWFVDPMMRHLGRPYYIALLTAAAFHGASHQAPQVFQVMTDFASSLGTRRFGRQRLRFYSSKHVSDDPVGQITVPTGYAVLATKETTVVDLVDRPREAGGYSNVATILRELGSLHGSALARTASRRGRAVVRRVGWLVERFGQVDDLEALRQAARIDLGEPTLLDPANPKRGRADREWAIRVNRTIEPDV
jgi:predicted transcriptional regulator of viral defense system